MAENPNLSQSLGNNIQASGNVEIRDNHLMIVFDRTTQPLTTAVKNWLPPIPGAWQERKEEQTILNYLTDNQTRLVGIYGAGGFGKSALAAQVYRRAEGFSHKLWANFQEPTDFGTFGRWLIQELLGKEYYARVRESFERDTDDELITKTINELGKLEDREQKCLLVLDNEVMDTRFNHLDLAGYFQELLKIYQRLTNEWQNPANDNERLNLGWAWTRVGTLSLNAGQIY